jgi:hypothetical protein
LSSYRQQIGNQKDTRRRFNNINDRQAYLNTMSEGQPSNNEGFNGQETVRYIKDKGVYHFIKRAGKWHSRLFTPAALTAQEEVDATVTVDTSDLEYDSLTISAGNGLSGGGSVALGSSTALDVNVDSSSLEISSDTIQVKDGGITESHLNSSVAGTGILGGAGTSLSIDYGSAAGTSVEGDTQITVTAGGGLSTGGTVTLGTGGTITVDASVDDATIEVSSDALQIKAAGVSATELATSVAGDGISGGAGTALAINLSEYSDVVPMSGDKFLTLDSDGSTEQLTTTDALSTLLAGDGLQSSSAVISVDISDFIGLGLLDDGSENIDVLFDGGYEDFDLSGADDSLITSAGATFVVADEPSVTTITPDASAASGSLNEAARSDHAHAIAAAAANIITPDAISAEGSSTSFSRADHAHAIATTAPGDLSVNLSASTEGTSTSFARADHTHDLDESITPLWTGLHTHNEDIYLYTGKKIYWVDSNQYISGDSADITIGSGGDILLSPTTYVGIGDTTPESLLHMKGANPVLTIQDTQTSSGYADARIRLAESDGLGDVQTYWDIHNSGHHLLLTRSDGTGNVVVSGTSQIDFNSAESGEYISGDGTDLTIGSGGAINLTATTDVVVPVDVGVTFGTGEKIEGDDTDLTLTSGADINLTATDDVNIPVDVGLTWGDGGEHIEGNNTDLTISSGHTINLVAVMLIKADSPKFHFRTPYEFSSVTDAYYIRAQTDGQMMTFGEDDLQANFSLISVHELMSGHFDSSFDDTNGAGWA